MDKIRATEIADHWRDKMGLPYTIGYEFIEQDVLTRFDLAPFGKLPKYAEYVFGAAGKFFGKDGVIIAVKGSDERVTETIIHELLHLKEKEMDETWISDAAEMLCENKDMGIDDAIEKSKSTAHVHSWNGRTV